MTVWSSHPISASRWWSSSSSTAEEEHKSDRHHCVMSSSSSGSSRDFIKESWDLASTAQPILRMIPPLLANWTLQHNNERDPQETILRDCIATAARSSLHGRREGKKVFVCIQFSWFNNKKVISSDPLISRRWVNLVCESLISDSRPSTTPRLTDWRHCLTVSNKKVHPGGRVPFGLLSQLSASLSSILITSHEPQQSR